MTLTQNYKFGKFGPKTEMHPIFMKFGIRANGTF